MLSVPTTPVPARPVVTAKPSRASSRATTALVPLLLKPKLRVHVEIMADGAELIAVTGNLFNDHRFWGT